MPRSALAGFECLNARLYQKRNMLLDAGINLTILV